MFNHEKSARSSDPDTSHEAARSMVGVAERHHAMIVAAMRGAGRPLAAEEIADSIGSLTHIKINRRMCELERDKVVAISDAPKHINRSGRKANRYRLT